MKVAIVKETREAEARVAMVPELVGKLTALGYDVAVEPGAGDAGAVPRRGVRWTAGATIDADALTDAGLVLSVQPLTTAQVRALASGTATFSFLPPSQSVDTIVERRDLGISSYAMELVPRISRAQSMDALSSQALVAGLPLRDRGGRRLRRFFPLNMTAAGTVPPAEVVVLGAGVAGLQAIATCKRLGAVVKAYDVRAAAAEEIRSMGAVGDRARARDARGFRRLRPRDDRGPADAAARPAGAVHRRRRRAHHDGGGAGAAGADAGDRRDGRADEAGVGRRRPRRRVRRQRRGLGGRRRRRRSAARRSGAG